MLATFYVTFFYYERLVCWCEMSMIINDDHRRHHRHSYDHWNSQNVCFSLWHCTLVDWFASFKTPMSTEEKKNWRRQSKKRRSRVKREVDELAHWTECEMGWMMMTMVAWHRGGGGDGGTMAWYPNATIYLQTNTMFECVCKRKVMRRSPPEMEWFFISIFLRMFLVQTRSS